MIPEGLLLYLHIIVYCSNYKENKLNRNSVVSEKDIPLKNNSLLNNDSSFRTDI